MSEVQQRGPVCPTCGGSGHYEPKREINPFGGESPTTCQHAWERHLHEQGVEICPYCGSERKAAR